MGSQTLRDAGVGLGGTVEMSGPDGPIVLVVVGRAAFPVIDDRSSVERGAVLTVDTLTSLATPGSIDRDLVVTWASGIAAEAANAALAEQLETEVVGERTPADVNNLHRPDALPRVMATVLAAFAALTATHSLVTSVRRGRHDLAVLRSIGFVRRQLTATIASLATAMAAASLLVGVPLGIVAGRVTWRLLARGIGVVDHPDTPALALVAVAIAAALIANVAALATASTAKRIAPASILRAG